MNNLQKRIVLILVLFGLWIFISVFWYVYGIRGFWHGEHSQTSNLSDYREDYIEEKINNKKLIKIDRVKKQNVNEENNINSEKTTISETVQERTIKCYTYLNSIIKPNSKQNVSSDVLKLEKFFNTYYETDLPEDGVYGDELLSEVKEFQKNNGLTQDGVVGPATAKIINVIYCVKTNEEESDNNINDYKVNNK